ncbi:MAG: restriction endonuclease subunit S [Acetobacter sp.]|nr:restriction endonuclease subunit S [Acetobacter sp.]
MEAQNHALDRAIADQHDTISAILSYTKITDADFHQNFNQENTALFHSLPTPETYGLSEWESEKLGNICEIKMCRRIFKEQTSSQGKIPFYKIGTFGEKADAFISAELYNDYKQKYAYPEKGEVLISAAGTIGKVVAFNGEPSYFQDSNIVWAKNDEQKIKNIFLFYFLKKYDWDKSATDGGTIKRLYNADLENLKLKLPPLEDQEKIVSAIEACEKEILKLENEKESLHGKTDTILKQYLF